MSDFKVDDTLQEGEQVGRLVVFRNIDGNTHAIAAGSMAAVCQTDDGAMLLLPGGRMVHVLQIMAVVLAWLDGWMDGWTRVRVADSQVNLSLHQRVWGRIAGNLSAFGMRLPSAFSRRDDGSELCICDGAHRPALEGDAQARRVRNVFEPGFVEVVVMPEQHDHVQG